jgi:argininosuccinate lyase
MMMHLSRFAEEMILWSTAEFRFIELPDALCTGSSIMPQKKNPDPLELVRGKTGRVYGHLMGLLTTMKALPLSYNRDLQEDKEPLFDAVDTLKGSLSVMTLCVEGMRVLKERMEGAAGSGFLEATDLAEYLVGKGVPFREAHHIVGRLVGEAVRRGWTSLESFSLNEIREFCEGFDEDAIPFLDSRRAAVRKDVPGGTSLRRVEEALDRAENYLGKE